MNIRETVQQALERNELTVWEVCKLLDFNRQQVRNAISKIDLTHHVRRGMYSEQVTFKVLRPRKHPMKRGIKRHNTEDDMSITWEEFKKQVEEAGVTDDMVIDYIDVEIPVDLDVHVEQNETFSVTN